MILRDLELMDMWSESDPGRRMRVTFPVSSVTGAASSSAVYFEVEPGDHIGTHTDSAEEIVLVLGGSGEGVVGEDTCPLVAGGLTLIPAGVPHDVRNTGGEPLRVLGFFSSATVVSVFDDPLAPIGRRVVGTPIPEEQQAAAAPTPSR
jgi:quercetin dioxygenase-like cupin family protein